MCERFSNLRDHFVEPMRAQRNRPNHHKDYVHGAYGEGEITVHNQTKGALVMKHYFFYVLLDSGSGKFDCFATSSESAYTTAHIEFPNAIDIHLRFVK